MVTRIFTGDDEVYVPDLGQWVKPGDEVEFDEAPDSEVWKTPAAAKKARSSKKVDVRDPELSDDHVVPEAPATEES
jgi:hypothetical protein